jgi:hypothetical protein
VQEAQEEHNSRQIGWRREIWTVDFYVQEELRRSLQKEETDSRRISLRNPVSRWIGRRCAEFKPLEECREGEQI